MKGKFFTIFLVVLCLSCCFMSILTTANTFAKNKDKSITYLFLTNCCPEIMFILDAVIKEFNEYIQQYKILFLVCYGWLSTNGDFNFNLEADLNNDDAIDLEDLSIVYRLLGNRLEMIKE